MNADQVSSWFLPSEVVLIDSFPRSAAGRWRVGKSCGLFNRSSLSFIQSCFFLNISRTHWFTLLTAVSFAIIPKSKDSRHQEVTHTIPFFGDNGKRCSTRNPHRTQVIDHLSGSCSIRKSFFVPVGQRGQIPFIIWLRLRFISMRPPKAPVRLSTRHRDSLLSLYHYGAVSAVLFPDKGNAALRNIENVDHKHTFPAQ